MTFAREPFVDGAVREETADFMAITEADEPESIIAALMSVAAIGTISDVTTCRAWTGAEFKAVARRLRLVRPTRSPVS